MEERCKHGMNPAWCSYCIRENLPPEIKKKELRQPTQRKDTTVFGSEALTKEDLNLAGWVIIHTKAGRDSSEFAQLDRATHVHIDGHPNLWIIQKILEKAPRLRQIQVIPTMYRKLHPDSHFKLCTERGVEIITGHVRPDLIWAEGENRSRTYTGQRLFFQNLQAEQKTLWDELLAMDFEGALVTARYFCLNGEEFISKEYIVQQLGYSKIGAATRASDLTNAVIKYLDPSFEAGSRAQQIAENMKLKVERLRKYFEVADYRQKFMSELGLDTLPTDLPIARYEVFGELIAARRAGKLESLRMTKPKHLRMLELRFGLISNTYLTLEEVAKYFGGLTRERIRQIEVEALGFLGISDED